MINHFTALPNEGENGRFLYISKMLQSEGFNVSVATTDFSHSKKCYRKGGFEESNEVKYTLIHEPLYKKNVSLRRFYSHYIFAKNIKSYLKKCDIPDLVYCSIPSLDVGAVVVKYAKKKKIPLIIDIQDLWPEAFQMVFNVQLISDLIFYQMKRKANKKDDKGLSIFLGTDLVELNKNLENQEITYKKDDNEIWIGYLGTLGSSYDIETALKSVKIVQEERSNVKLILLGDGPLEEKFRKISLDMGVNAVFLGRRKYIEAMCILKQCEIVLNPLVVGAAQSIINKVGDYAALGIPVVNSLQNEEYQQLLEKYRAGINVKCEDANEMARAIMKLIDNVELRNLMGKNNRKLAEEKFDREKTYRLIVDVIRSVKK